MSNITSKEYIKKIVIKGLKGEKIDQQESTSLEKEVANFTVADWRKVKIIAKEAIKEEVDERIDNSQSIPAIWKSETKKLVQAVVNFVSAFASEELIIASIRLEKEKASPEQRIKTLAPLMASVAEKIAARKPVYQVKNYHKAEKSFSQRYKNIKSMITLVQAGFWRIKGGSPEEKIAKVRDFFGKFIKNCKNLSADEVKVLKEKGKEWVKESLATSQISQTPEFQTLFKAGINFWDAVLDEEVVAELSNVTIELLEIVVKNVSFEELDAVMNNKNSFKEQVAHLGKFAAKIESEIQKSGLLSRSRSLTTKLTDHLNRLAGEEKDSQPLSPAEEQAISQRIDTARELSNENSSNKTGSGLIGLAPSSLVKGSNLEDLNFDFETLDKKLGEVKSSPKWYQNPWVIVPSLIGVGVVGGLVVWFLMRKKEPKRKPGEYY